jgi:hypothetical protein
MKWLKRTVRVVCITALVLAMLAFVFVQFQQRMLRWRAERLMADTHRIRLYESNWTDSQRLMSRWGAWGHYDGSCTAKDCRYSIQLSDWSTRARDIFRPEMFELLIRLKAFSLYRWFGGRYFRITFTFVVHDGTIWRTGIYTIVEVPPKLFHSEDDDYALMVGATSRQSLHDGEGGGHVLGSDEDLAQHPYYTAGRPGGCTSCMMVAISYSTHTPQAEVERLTSFDLSCLTRFFFCKMPEDLLPAAREWHIYHDDEIYAIDQQFKSMPPRACDIPLWALARDSGTVLVVDGISVSQEEYGGLSYEWAAVKVVSFLKGAKRWPVGSMIKVLPFGGQMASPPFQLAERLAPGKRYVILPSEGLYGKPELYGPLSDTTHEPQIGLPRCGVQEDTPEVRRELEKGFAQNDDLRGPLQ